MITAHDRALSHRAPSATNATSTRERRGDV
jgi:hypothetical protein